MKEIEDRISENIPNAGYLCAVPGCGKETMRSIGKGLAQFHCRYHVQYKARHGSHWCPSYRAADLKPYITSATAWIKARRDDLSVSLAITMLQGLLDGAGPVESGQNIKRWSAARRAKVAFARLREAGIKPERILGIYMGVCALIEDDRGSHRTDEFRIVQAAKAIHRLASGTHKAWDISLPGGMTAPVRMDVYPKSSGLVLRRMGEEVEMICRDVAEMALDAVREAKTAKFGPHPSHLPGWKPLWQQQREKIRDGA